MTDLRFACRQLLKNKGFTAVAVLTLALGIGANTTLFSVLSPLLARPLPYPDSERLVRVYRTAPGEDRWPHSAADFLDHQKQNRVFQQMAALTWSSYAMTEGAAPERVSGLRVTGNFFDLLAMPPLLGRTLRAEDDVPGNDRRVVLSYGFWQRRFAGDSNIVGRAIRLDGENCTVLGVMPAAFDFKLLFGRIDLWRPVAFTPEFRSNRGDHWLNAIARLKPGVSLGQAQSELDRIAQRLAEDYPDSNYKSGIHLTTLRRSLMSDEGWRLSWFLLATVGFVLLIACANVANLQLARTTARHKEIAIRTALGAGRARLLGQLLTESMVLAFVGGAAGLLLGIWGSEFLGARVVIDGEGGFPISLDWPVLGYTFGLTLLTGIVFGLVPALHATKPDLHTTLKESGRGTSAGRAHQRSRNLLVVAEVAAALVALIGAGLFLRGLQHLTTLETGFETRNLLTFRITLPEGKYSADERAPMFQRLAETIRALPGVELVGVGTSIPLNGPVGTKSVVLEGEPVLPPGQRPLVNFDLVNPDYFRALGMSLKQGRFFTERDNAQSPRVVIVNERFAGRHWPGQNAIGKRLTWLDSGEDRWATVIGIVGNVRQPGSVDQLEPQPHLYESIFQHTWPTKALVVKTAGPPLDLARAIRSAVGSLDSDLPIYSVKTLDQAIRQELANLHLCASMLAGFGALGLALAMIGIYGVISYSVAQRTNEIGVRMALGARAGDVLALILKQGLLLVGGGCVIGLVGAFVLGRLISGLLFGISPVDPTTFLLVLALFLSSAVVACFVPARRAAAVDPMKALRHE